MSLVKMAAARLVVVVVWISVSHLCDSRHLVKRSDDGDPLEPIVAQQGQAIDEMRAEITAMKAQIADVSKLVTFMVSVPSTQDLAHDPHVKFGTPSLNIGGGFHTATSTFVAPVSGLYVLFVKVTAASGAVVNYTIFGLMKDGKVIAETETNDDDNADRSSVQVIVQLAAGESLWVQKIGGGGHSISGGGVASTFGGFLLRAGAHG